MDQNSIVSFNNETATLQDNDFSINDLALQAMRDRCLLFQKRIQSLEDENMRLKYHGVQNNDVIPNKEDKKELLSRIAELTKQKSQLIHHIFMVTCENKNLWNKVASLKINKVEPTTNETDLQHNRLVRSNTYITETSNKENVGNLPEPSLHDIPLNSNYKCEKVDEYEEMDIENYDEYKFNLNSIGLTYLEECNNISFNEIKNETEKLYLLKKELLQQEADLKLIIGKLEIFKDGKNVLCVSCKNKSKQTTSSVQTEATDSIGVWETPANSSIYNENINSSTPKTNNNKTKQEISQNSGFHNVTADDDPIDKMCPMCGEYFRKSVQFDAFQKHVEGHFVGDPDFESLDNYEVVKVNKQSTS